MKRLGITLGIMGQIIARLIAWLAGKVVIYALILGILLARSTTSCATSSASLR